MDETGPQQPAGPWVCRNHLEQLVQGDREFLRELVDLFHESGSHLVAEIQKGMRQGDFDAVSRAAHGLKGMLGNMAKGLPLETAEALEQAADLKDALAVGRLFRECRARYLEIGRELREIVSISENSHLLSGKALQPT